MSRCITVGKGLISSFAHEYPRIVIVFTFNNLIVQLFYCPGNFHRTKWYVQSSNIQMSNFL